MRVINCFTAAALLFVSTRADGWNRAGHMVSGAMVYSLLKREDAAALESWTAVLKRHPQFEDRWQAKLETVEHGQRDQVLWMLATRWPDDVRGDANFDRPDWHYINFPFKPDNQPASVETAGPAPVNIITAYRANLEILKSRAADAEKAVALCWVLHLVGDVHQPLHTAKLFTTDFPAPDGDRGGTLFYIRATPDAEAITLHKFWDDSILGSEDFRAVRNMSIVLRRKYPAGALTELAPRPAESDFRSWAESESFALARRHAYLKGRLAGSPSREQAAVLPEGYGAETKRVSERRLALAAHRLVEILRGKATSARP